MSIKTLLSWSGGKDCAFALFELQANHSEYTVSGLLTSITADYDRVSMHGFPTSLLKQQAIALNLPLHQLTINARDTKDDYEQKMSAILATVKADGVSAVAFGDIFLEDLRKYREANLAKINMQAVFPLWNRSTAELAQQFIAAGFKAIITCVDTQALDASFAGREFDASFLADLPSGVDPCGENGEFHSFVYAGPIFNNAIAFSRGESILRDGRYCFFDLQEV
ncbi:MAG: ATP-binding protein [Bacillota bacterium]